MTSQRTIKISILTAFVLLIGALIVLSAVAAPAQQASNGQPSAKSSAAPTFADQARILDTYGKLPLSFEANQGQADARVKFLSHTSGYSLFLTGDEAVLTLSGSKTNTDKPKVTATSGPTQSGISAPKAGPVLRMKLRNANPAAKITGVDELAGTSNYFIGNDASKWRTSVPTYAKVKYEEIYSGIDLVYYGNQRQLEYDFIVAPGADPRRIAFDIGGAKRIRRDQHGDLVLNMGEGEIRWHKPVVYQEKDGTRQEIAARYSIADKNRVAFDIAQYDASEPLYIDPLIYSTFLGGSNYLDSGSGIAVDSAGNAYVTGSTTSRDFPITPGAFQTNFQSQNEDAFVTKISPDGSTLLYSTYLGAGTWNSGIGIAVDSSGDAFVLGSTQSPYFPTTPGAFQTTCKTATYGGVTYCVDEYAFVTKLNPTGSGLVYSTFLGDPGIAGYAARIAVDSAGSSYVAGSTSTDFPVTPGAFQTVCNGCSNVYPWSSNAFVSKLNSSGSALVYSTYLGSGNTEGSGIALDSSGDAYVVGSTNSPSFPTTSGAFQTTISGGGSAFVTEINPSGSGLVYSTYLSGSGFNNDAGYGIAVDTTGNAYVTGFTGAADFPTTPGAFQTVCGPNPPTCGANAFVTKFNPAGSALVYSTYLGGGGYAFGFSIAIDSWGEAFVTGSAGPNFPVKNPLRGNPGPGAFVAKFSPTGSALVYSTYLGGNKSGAYGNSIAVDGAGNAYVTGSTTSADFSATPGAFQPTCGGTTSCPFVSKIYFAATSTTLASSLSPSTYGQKVTWTATTTALGPIAPTGKVKFTWDGHFIGSATLNGSGVATLTLSDLNADPYPLTATYEGDANNVPSTSAILNQVVQQATSAAALTSSPNPSTTGQAVTFTATITSPTTVPKGPVTFTAGNTVLGSVELSAGKATFTTSTLAAGSTKVTATYSGDSNIAKSSASVTQTVSGSVIPPVFTMPYNGTLYLLQEGGSAAATTEFGLGTSPTNFVHYYTGLPNSPNPTGEVTVGYFPAGTVINFGMFSQWGSESGWAFSTGTDQASIIAFTDPDNNLGMGGSITQQTSSTTWLLHLDDALSYLVDDDDNDVLIQIRVAPSSPPSAQKSAGVKPAR